MSTFKPVLCLCLVALLMASAAALPLAADNDKPFIFVNTASDLLNIIATNTGMARFAEIAREKGFEIDHGQHQSFDGGSVFEGIVIYVFLDTNMLFLQEDRVALRKWVRDGGILIIGDWTAPAPADGFLTEFGVELMPVKIISSSELSLVPNSPLAGPLKINKLKTEGFRPLKILDNSKAQEILRYEDGKPAMIRSISNAGKGEIITIGCLRILINDNFLDDGDIKLFDNDKLVQNLFDYMRDRLGLNDNYDLNLTKLKTKGSGSFVPGESVKFVAKIRNIGNADGEATDIAFYLEKAGSAPSARIEIATASVPLVKKGKKIKIVKKAFLPDDLAPGKYTVIAVVDPDEASEDGKAGNNTAVAKKKIDIE